MNNEIKDILQSDLLERYVMGEVSDQEILKVEALRQSSTEIRNALNELELSLEKTAIENKITTPAYLIDKIIYQDQSAKRIEAKSSLLSRIIPYAACLIISYGLIWIVKGQTINKLKNETVVLQEEIKILQADCNKTSQQFAFLNDKNTIPALLKGTDYAPESEVVIFLNKVQKKCLLRVSNLNEIPSDKTYQLWADIEGEMISMGTFDYRKAGEETIPMAYLEKAESLNITIENKGGSDHPDVSTLSAVAVL